MLGVGVDGPLARDLMHVQHYRAAEAILSRGKLQKRGKPGQTSSPTGQQLHLHATDLARLAIQEAVVAEAAHADAIHPLRIVEAFPNAFLLALLEESRIPRLNRDASDRFWPIAAEPFEGLDRVFQLLLPGRQVQPAPGLLTDHEERAALVCALTALSVVADTFVAVGDPVYGDIVLPGISVWGDSGSRSWLLAEVEANALKMRRQNPPTPGHANARVWRAGFSALAAP